MEFEQCKNKICCLKKTKSEKKVYLIMYVNDCFFIGTKRGVKEMLDKIATFFSIKRSTKIEDFIGCTIRQEEGRILLSQLDLINKLLKMFEEDVKKMRDHKTLAGMGFKAVRPREDSKKLSNEAQTKY